MFQKDQPLWLPKGSVRSILALGLVSATVAAVFVGVPSEGLAIIAAMANASVLFYFKDRSTTGNGE